MKFTILTLFPEMVRVVLSTSMLDRAQKAGTVEFDVQDLRTWGSGVHKSVDDAPYGGGAGMVLRIDVVDRALQAIGNQQSAISKRQNEPPRIILLTPQGTMFDQATAESMAAEGRDLILIAGHYEGFDERIRSLVDDEISIGDFVLTGGELPALTVIDAITRLLPGALGSDDSVKEESFSQTANSKQQTAATPRLLEYPHYTRPDRYSPTSRTVGELTVPDVLKSGHHAAIATWRQTQSLERTKARRPDLLANSKQQTANSNQAHSSLLIADS